MSDIRTKIDYAAAAEALKKYLNLSHSPVAVGFVQSKEQIPAGMEELSETTRHCQMVNLARKEGKVFYATAEKHACQGGAWALGLKAITPSLKSGEFYFKLGKFDTWAACKRTIDRIPHVESGLTYATMYAPLEKTPFTPTVVLIVAEPRVMLKLAQSVLYKLGGRVESNFAGIQSVCADTTAQTYLNGKVNFSLGCDGSRKFSGIADGEMVMGIPVELLPEIAAALPVVTGAPGSI
ncbi:MAG: DUF169 domain-containing protein [Methanofollis sp.]|uniref:DUF169 domain-containing protein n=1 Tax=Methanofollis sp. TaxID=2052835 RepID=UPI00263863DD|nr:DUF169 domain-containing protein [Methanofollis sp.]MDD4254402.1 DUF169 domain-containing protein [Methanofollis sp.]